MAKKRRNYSRPSKGSLYLYKNSPESKWINQWLPPKNSAAFFSMDSDAEFKKRHPIGYGFLVALGMFALFMPVCIYSIYASSINLDDNGWLILGWVGAFIVGIGLFNFVAIIIKQYLGHLVSILSFLIGGILAAVSLHML